MIDRQEDILCGYAGWGWPTSRGRELEGVFLGCAIHFYLFERQRSSLCWVTSHMPATAKGLESNLGLPHGWQGPKYLGYHLLFPRVCMNKKLELEVESGLELRHSGMGCGHPKQCLNHHTKCLPQNPWIAYFWDFPFKIFGLWLTAGSWNHGKQNHR